MMILHNALYKFEEQIFKLYNLFSFFSIFLSHDSVTAFVVQKLKPKRQEILPFVIVLEKLFLLIRWVLLFDLQTHDFENPPYLSFFSFSVPPLSLFVNKLSVWI